ncbi:glycolate oxidase FAD binding subunit [Kribbella antiqua]|uniref:Glycolate oxidase FAD binding subunit n=1 Tax=Kribbella antiqua TaxID=2512217 RepID=A0A4R2IDA0_9ACTN|nr:FAD-binding oxidoreductase [Kribbella antiqua]TCO42571.1 glycolate oxidase FAD binding subunit [Kribbella antiqua]
MPDVQSELERACELEPAKDADAVVGELPQWVVRPTTTAQVADIMRVASAHDLAVVARGAGTKLRWGNRPQRVDVVLDTTGLDALVEHAEGDLILVTGAGRRLETIQQDISASGQQLGIDPARKGTVGGAVATASTGPLRLRHGAVRDLVIGMTFVRADGVVAHSGGKVVKNVAGYDLAKIMTGSYGTLGVITEVAFRLHPIPQGRRWVSVEVDSAQQAHEAVQALVHSQVMAAAIELDWSDGRGQVAVQIVGHADGVDAICEEVIRLLARDAESSTEPPSWWGGEPAGALLKVTYEIGALTQLLEAIGSLRFRGSPGVGTGLLGVSDAVVDVVANLRRESARFGGSVVVLDAPEEARGELDLWGPVRGLELMRSVKQRFDPGRLLSPGRFVGGI